jgi:AbrB family looped-hinge helix DNA binding protein
MSAILKDVDKQGRIVLPAAWRKRNLRGTKVLLRPRDGMIEVVPQEVVDLTAYFDGPRVDVKADLANWKAVRRELSKR